MSEGAQNSNISFRDKNRLIYVDTEFMLEMHEVEKTGAHKGGEKNTMVSGPWIFAGSCTCSCVNLKATRFGNSPRFSLFQKPTITLETKEQKQGACSSRRWGKNS